MEIESTARIRVFEEISRRRFIRMMAYGTAGLSLGAGVSSYGSGDNGKAGQKQPNILFITTDEQRFDTISAGGNKFIQTPNLDRMAGQGVVFTRTYCQAPLCQPSRASLLTGRYIHDHGCTWNKSLMNPEWPTMAKQLQKKGYHTAVIGKTHFYDRPPAKSLDFRENAYFIREFGFDDVFEEFDKYIHVIPDVITPYTEYLKAKGLLETYLAQVPSLQAARNAPTLYWRSETGKLPQEHDLTSFLTRAAADWLANQTGDKPFFLWLSYPAPHPPLIDDPTWAAVYQGKDVPIGPRDWPYQPDNAWGRYLRAWIRGTGVEQMTPEILAECIRHYYGLISLIDQGVGDLRSVLQKLKLEDNTWMFFTADHGDMMGDHGLMFKNVFYKGSVLVPDIIRPPKGMPGRRVDGPVQSIDLTATILDITGADPVEGQRGRSLVPEMNGERNGRSVVFSELAGHGNRGNFFVMAATDRYRYTYDKENDIHCELFDLKEDPDELNNLVEDQGYRKLRDTLHGDYVEPFMADKTG